MRGHFVKPWRRMINAIPEDADGQALVEYSLIFVLVIIVALVSVATMGDNVTGLWARVRELPFW